LLRRIANQAIFLDHIPNNAIDWILRETRRAAFCRASLAFAFCLPCDLAIRDTFDNEGCALFRAINRYDGNLPAVPGVSPTVAPVIASGLRLPYNSRSLFKLRPALL